ncbi:Signal transduction protein [Mycena indigotica]|uniref:Signal transduction protein n=1 Tax=Mycena indigotica TaxID=2126181 RepID=A0A8H6TEU1_9AGAR|nr:Signal transduction protein [Mycena indigotica]KAF7316200.1 Signal transduction protein [Mycena indigotica]
MKFARYLEDAQTPEWQRAYIDYRLLKKRITAIRRAMASQEQTISPISSRINTNLTVPSQVSVAQTDIPNSPRSSLSVAKSTEGQQPPTNLNDSLPDFPGESSQRRDPFHRSTTMPASIGSSARRTASFTRMFSSSNSRLSRRITLLVGGQKPHPYSDLPLRELLPLLSPLELAFFTTLDAEVEKIEKFYVAREHDMKLLTNLLEQQLAELDEHRKLFNAAHSVGAWSTALNANALLKLKTRLQDGVAETASSKDKGKGVYNGSSKAAETPAFSTSNLSLPEQTTATGAHTPGTAQLHPSDFHDAKHKLRKAVMEHYRGLEMLQNYRILNLTGIRKALKKFQKITKISAQKAYNSEKVEKTTFASAEENLKVMMDKMEAMYAIRFTHGDKKKALERLRLGPMHKSHHVSTFWSGLLVGLALPALASGLYYSYQQATRDAIPGWDALLLVYATFLIPVVFSFLVGINVLIWSNTRINYVFIFEFDLRTRMDHREYFEIPSLLFAALCGAFWLSFAQIGAPSVDPTIWPLVWLGFAGVIMLDPLPLIFKPSRWWFLRSLGKLMTSGTRPVEFADFWMGDQFCSLVFSLSNLYLVGCLYDDGFNSHWRQCGATSRLWPLSFFLAILPFLIRFVQSIKRYADSGVGTHLVNAGKYFSGIIAYLCYFLWRHRGGYGATFMTWCLFQTLYSIYAGSWDLFMDWSIFKLHENYPLLRKELLYSSHVYVYYFAIISNTLLRFVWVIYIPNRGLDMTLRSFIAACCEMLRRWQWNFYRLENEQLGNRDQYRATREVPLPYSLDERRAERDDEFERKMSPRWLPQRGLSLRRQRGAIEV